MVRLLPALPFFLVTLCLLHGCAVDNRVRYRDGEGVFSSDWFDRIKPGSTSLRQLTAQFGPPFRTVEGPDGGQLASWEFLRQQQQRRSVLGLVRHTNTEETRHYLHAVLRKGVVLKRWQDQTREADAAAVFQAVGLRDPAPVVESEALAPATGSVPSQPPLRVRDVPHEDAPTTTDNPKPRVPADASGAPKSEETGFVRPL